MRKSKKIKTTYDAIGSLTPEEAGELLSAGANSTAIDWKNHDLPSYSDIFIEDPPATLGGDGSDVYSSPYGPAISSVSISDLEDRIKKLEDQSQEHEALIAMLRAELAEAKKRGGFWRRPNI